MSLFLVPLLIGFVFAGASAFTTAYSRRFGERGGQTATAALRNVLGIPLWLVGYAWAWLTPAPWVVQPGASLTVLGWIVVLAGAVPVVVGHLHVGLRSHLPSLRDTLVRHGLYACVRHPIYAGGLLVMPGLALIRPSISVVLASALVLAWLFLQARLEEIDLLQRLPEYAEYLRQVPRFLPRPRKRERSP